MRAGLHLRRGLQMSAFGVLLAFAFAPRARAGNDDGVLLGNEAAMTGGAVMTMVRDGSGVWYNPAGLAAIERNAVDVNGSAIELRTAQEGRLISSTTGESNDGGYLEIVSVPSAVTVARRLEPGVVLGFGIFAPRYSQHTTRTRLDAISGANTARWTLSSADSRSVYHAGGALGVQISETLRFGVSLFGVYRERYDSFQTAGSFQLGSETTHLIARGGIRQVRSVGVELGVGVQWEPHPGVVIGFTARSPGLEMLTQVRSSTTSIDAAVSDLTFDTVDFEPEEEDAVAPGLAVLTPGRFNLGLGYRFDRGWVAGEIDVQPPLDIDPLLKRRFVWNVRVGGRYALDERVGLGAGFFTDQSEDSPIGELGDTQVDFYGGTFGIEIRTPHALGPNEAAPSLIFSTTIALRYAFGVGKVAGLLFDPDRGTHQETVPVRTTIHEMGLHIGSALYF